MLILAPTDERSKTLLPIHVITAGTDHDQENRCRPEGAVLHHLFFVEKGSVLFKTPKGSFSVKEGNALFLEKNQPMNYRAEGKNCRTGWVTFDGPGAEGILSYFRADNMESRPSKNLSPLPSDFCRMIRQGLSPARLSEELFRLLQRFFEASKTPTSPHVRRAKEYLQTHYREDLSVEDVAHAVSISPSLLFRKFREEGTTPVEYLRTVRIEKAKQLLIDHPDKTVGEISRECGFSDCAYFCKVFRAAVGLSPGKFRDQYQS